MCKRFYWQLLIGKLAGTDKSEKYLKNYEDAFCVYQKFTSVDKPNIVFAKKGSLRTLREYSKN